MSRFYYVKMSKTVPGKIIGTLRTNVPNLMDTDDWDYEMSPYLRASKLVTRDGGRFWWFDEESRQPRLRALVRFEPEANRVEVGQLHRVTLRGVPEDVPSVNVIVNISDSVRVNRGEVLEIGWRNPTVVTLSLDPDEVKVRAEPILIYFEEPGSGEI